MKKMLKVLGIIAVVICLFVSVVACDRGDKDSVDVVAISESEYASAEEALKGYVKEELAFSKVRNNDEVEEVLNVKYLSHESKGEVAIGKINLTDAQKTNVVSAEKFAVKVDIGSLDKDKEETFTQATQTVIVLKYGEKFKFMVSTPQVGERLTNSYVKMLTDINKYENCTMKAVGQGKREDEENTVFDSASVYKFTTEASSFIMYYDETRFNNGTPGGDENTNDRVRYLVKHGDGIAMVSNRMSEGEEVWTATALEGEFYKDINTVKAYSKYMFNNNIFYLFNDLPGAVFIKTAGGFEFKLENVAEGGDKWTYEYKITVVDNKITAIDMKDQHSWTGEDEKTIVEWFGSSMKLGDFGSTTVSIPEYVTEALKAL